MIRFEAYHSSSSGNLYRASYGDSHLLLEAGVPLKKIRAALRYQMHAIEGCLVTHAHDDHALAGADVMGKGIDLYCSRETAEAKGWNHHRLCIVEPGEPFDIGDMWRCVAFSTEHDCPGSLGFLIAAGGEKLLFATDTYYVRHRFVGLNIIAVECNWSKGTLDHDIAPGAFHRLVSSHMSLETCLGFLRAQDLSSVREIHLLHVSGRNGHAELFQREVERATGLPVWVADA